MFASNVLRACATAYLQFSKHICQQRPTGKRLKCACWSEHWTIGAINCLIVRWFGVQVVVVVVPSIFQDPQELLTVPLKIVSFSSRALAVVGDVAANSNAVLIGTSTTTAALLRVLQEDQGNK